MARFWVYVDSKVQGPVDIPSLRKVPGFNLLTQVCQEGESAWRMADEVIEIKSYFIAPPRLNSFALDTGNAAPKLEIVEAAPEEMMLPEVKPAITLNVLPGKVEAEASAGSGASLRAVCEVCGYKNPRDVAQCMKCGEAFKSAPISKAPVQAQVSKPGAIEFKPIPNLPTFEEEEKPAPAPEPAPVAVAAAPIDPKASTMIEIPMSKLILGCAAALLLAGASFFGIRSWKKKHPARAPKAAAAAAKPASESTHAATPSHAASRTARRAPRRYLHPPSRHTAVEATETQETPAESAGTSETAERPAKPVTPETAGGAEHEERSEGASYRVIPVATPLQKRYSAPINSPYAVKRRSNEELWSTQEGHAIQQVQRYRIYGGQRTIQRNADILMQILRDREYNTAFESGKRLMLYNDMDWSAVDKEGPVYEVRLTFSGGKEADGSPRKPLKFAFAADIERGTVEPGGQDQIRSNTLHAFFDESRIAPEDRRAIAKDTEEVVQAAQPGASPLALDTVIRQFAKVYSTDALSRIAQAYGFSEIKRKLEHDPRLGSQDVTETVLPVPSTPKPVRASSLPGLSGAMPKERPSRDGNAGLTKEPAKPVPFSFPSKGRAVDFKMERGEGKERIFMLRATSSAAPGRLWELLTGYDRLKQFIPDMLASEKEGQDGAATIVHTVCLTRFMVFVFKVNLHMRMIEHPREHQLEFERIAGEFESFRGSIDVGVDPATKESVISFRASLVPTGRMMGWTLEGMARKLLVTFVDALRTKAESV